MTLVPGMAPAAPSAASAPAVAPSAPGTAAAATGPGAGLVAKLIALSKSYPRDLPRLLNGNSGTSLPVDSTFVAWVAGDGLPVIARMTKLTDPSVKSPGDIEDGFAALAEAAKHMPKCPLRTEAKLLLAVHQTMIEAHFVKSAVVSTAITGDPVYGIAYQTGYSAAELVDLAHGDVTAVVNGLLAGEADAYAVASDVADMFKKQTAGSVWGIIRDTAHAAGSALPPGFFAKIKSIVDGAPQDAAIDESLKGMITPLLQPYDAPLKTIESLLSDSRMQALVDLGLKLKLPFDEVMLSDVRSGAFNTTALKNLINGGLGDSDVKSLLDYMGKKLGHYDVTVAWPSVLAILAAYPNLKDAHLETLAEGLHFTANGTHLKVDYTQAMKDRFGPSKSMPRLALPAANASAGAKIVGNLRYTVDTVPEGFKELLGSKDVIATLAKNPALVDCIIQLVDGETLNVYQMNDSFAAFTVISGQLAADSPLKPLLDLIPTLRRILGDSGARDAVTCLLVPEDPSTHKKSLAVLDDLKATAAALHNGKLAATLKVTQALGLSLPKTLNDLYLGKQGGIDPVIVEHIIDRDPKQPKSGLTTPDVRALYKDHPDKKSPLALKVNDPEVKTVLASYGPLANANLKMIDSLIIAKGGGVKVKLTVKAQDEFGPRPPSITANDPAPDPTDAGAVKTFNLRRALDTLPTAFASAMSTDALVKWLANNPSKLNDIMLLLSAKPTDANYTDEMNTAFGALGEFGALLPDSSDVKPLLALIPTLRAMFGDAQTQSVIAPLLAPSQPSLTAIYAALTDPRLAATVQDALGMGLSLPTMLNDILYGNNVEPPPAASTTTKAPAKTKAPTNKTPAKKAAATTAPAKDAGKKGIDPAIIAHLIDATLSAPDVKNLFNYILGQIPEMKLSVQDPNVQMLLSAFQQPCQKDDKTGKQIDATCSTHPLNGQSLASVQTISLDRAGKVDVALTAKAQPSFNNSPPTLHITDPHAPAVSGTEMVYNLRTGLDTMPPVLKPLLGDADVVNWLAANPAILSKILFFMTATPTDKNYHAEMNEAFDAIKQLGAYVKNDSLMKPLIVLMPIMRTLFNDDGAQSAVAEILKPEQAALTSMSKALVNPRLSATLKLTQDAKISIANVISDLVKGEKLPADVVARVIDGAPTASDMALLMQYMLNSAHGNVTLGEQTDAKGKVIGGHVQALKDTLALFPSPTQVNLQNVKSFSFSGTGDNKRATMRFSAPPVKMGPLAVDISALNGKLILDAGKQGKMEIDADFGTYFKAAYNLEFDTGHKTLDTFLNVLAFLMKVLLSLAVILPLLCLVGEAVGVKLQLSDQKDGTHLQMNALFMNFDSVRAKTAAAQPNAA